MDVYTQRTLNPFIKINQHTGSQFVSSSCSLNRAIMAKTPIDGIDDSVEGKCFKDIFSTGLIVAEIKDMAGAYNIDLSGYKDAYLPQILDRYLVSNDIMKKELAHSVVNKFGKRLGMIFLALKKGERENRDARPEWSEEHWNYWKKLKTVILVGGLASGLTGRYFKENIFYVFDRANIEPYNIRLFDNATYVGVQGASEFLMDDDTISLVLDMGHTNIKRCIVRKENGRLTSFNSLESIPTPYMKADYSDDDEKFSDAIKLHKYIVNLIYSTYKNYNEKLKLSDTVVISVANYNSKGILNAVHGGYAKLSMLGGDYEKLLSEDISSELHKKVDIRLVHDGTANALYFKNVKESVCISLGTAFGIGFPDIDIK